MSDANDLRGHFEVTIGGNARIVKFRHHDLRILDQQYGSAMQVIAQGLENPLAIPLSFVFDALCVGLQHHGDKRLTKAKLEELVPTHEVFQYAKPVVMALLLAYRGPEEFAKIVEDVDGAAEGADANPPMTTAGASSSS